MKVWIVIEEHQPTERRYINSVYSTHEAAQKCVDALNEQYVETEDDWCASWQFFDVRGVA